MTNGNKTVQGDPRTSTPFIIWGLLAGACAMQPDGAERDMLASWLHSMTEKKKTKSETYGQYVVAGPPRMR